MSDVIDTGSKRRLPDAKRPRAEAIGKKRKIDRSEDELELGRFVGTTDRKPRSAKAAPKGQQRPSEVIGPRRQNVDLKDVVAKSDDVMAEMQIAAPLDVDNEQPGRRRRAQRRSSRPDDQGTEDWRRFAVVALISALLVAATAAATLFLPRYQTHGEPLIADPAFEAGLIDWQQAGLVSKEPSDPAKVTLESLNPEAGTHLLQDIDLPSGDTLLVLRARVQGDDVVTGSGPWDSARIYLAQLDADGEPIWDEDHNLFTLSGTTDVRNYSRAFSIPSDIETVRLGIEMKNATGRLTVSKLELATAERDGAFVTVIGGLLIAWGALVLYTAVKTFGGIESVRIRICLAVLSALTVIALMLPGNVHDIGTGGIASRLGIDGVDVDAVGHGVMFAALAFLVRLGRPFDPLWLHVGAWGLIAIASEVLQLFTVDREPSMDDLWVDGLGILVGLALAEITSRMRKSPMA